MRRRDFIAALSAAVTWPLGALGQAVTKLPRIGVLWHAAGSEQEEPYFSAFNRALADSGYIDGRNVVMEHRFPNEMPDHFRAMASELVQIPVDILIAIGAASSQYVKTATATIPIIFVFVPDPVGMRLVDSLARPGGNATGLTSIAPELSGRRLQLLKEVVPNLTKVALLINPDAEVSRLYVEQAEAAARQLGVAVEPFKAASLAAVPGAFDAMAAAGAKALMIGPEGLFFVGRKQIAQLALDHKLPLCVWSHESFEAGALMSYGPDMVAICRGAARFVDKILKGTRPAEIPVEQPTQFQFLVNLQIAKRLGVTVPTRLLSVADEVIE